MTAAVRTTPMAVNQHVACNDSSISQQIVNEIVAETGTSSRLNITCGAHRWQIATCTPNTRSLCIDCADPCTATCKPDVFYLTPCRQACPNTNELLRVLNVDFTTTFLFPDILTSAYVPEQYGVSGNLTFSTDGSVNCGAFEGREISNGVTIEDVMSKNFMMPIIDKRAIFTLDGLLPSTDYTLYCFTTAKDGSQMSKSVMIDTQYNFRTACCKYISIDIVSTAIPTTGSLNFIRISWNAAPSTPVLLHLYAEHFTSIANRDNNDPSGVRLPLSSNVSTINALRKPMEMFYTALGSSAGFYVIKANFLDGTGDDFQFEYSNGNKLRMLSSESEPDAPKMISAAFEPDGTFILLSFDSATDRSKLTENGFSCNLIFDMGEEPSCLWLDSTHIKVISSEIPVGASITLMGGKIKARCTASSASTCATWVYSSSCTISVANSATPIKPTVTFVAASYVGPCTDVSFSLALSSGTGGRPWASISLSTFAADGRNTTALQEFLDSTFDIRLVIKIPYALVPPSSNSYLSSFQFSARLCNFLGSCNTGIHMLYVLTESMPTVSLNGPIFRTIQDHEKLVLGVSTSLAECSTLPSSRGTLFAWTVYKNNKPFIFVQSASKEKNKFVVKPFELNPGYYRFVVGASHPAMKLGTFVSSTVIVNESPPEAIIEGPISRDIFQGEDFKIVARLKNRESIVSVPAGSMFTWNCVAVAPVVRDGCDEIDFAPTVNSTDTMFLHGKNASIGTTYELSVIIELPSIMTSAKVIVTIRGRTSPLLSLRNPPAVINAEDIVTLVADVVTVADHFNEIIWMHGDSHSLDAFAMTSTNQTVGGVLQASFSLAIPLSIKGGMLTPGTRYTFVVACNAMGRQGGSARASIDVLVNAAPTPGNLFISPSAGLEMVQEFSLTAVFWDDLDLPMNYEFSYSPSQGNDRRSIVHALSAASSAVTRLPFFGNGENNVKCTLLVVDSIGGKSNSSKFVTITQHITPSFDFSTLYAQMLTTVTTSDEERKMISLLSNSLNKEDCSLAPNCTLLNRQPCHSLVNTCGACLDAYISPGSTVELNSNIPCFPKLQSAASSNALETDWYTKSKTCANNCTERGSCEWRHAISRSVVSSCLDNDPICIPYCACREGFSGAACQFNSTQLTQRISLRSQMLTALISSVESSDQSYDVLYGSSVALHSILLRREQLRLEDLISARTLANYLIASASTYGVAFRHVEALADVVSQIALFMSIEGGVGVSDGEVPSRRKLSTITLDGEAQKLGASISSIVDAFMAGMVMGQVEATLVTDNFKAVASSRAIFAGIPLNVSTVLPTTSVEQGLGIAPSRVRLDLPPSEVTGYRSVGTYTIKTPSLGLKSLYQANNLYVEPYYLSDPVTVKVSDDITPDHIFATHSTSLYLNLTDRNARPISPNYLRTYYDYCFENDYSAYHHVCADKQVVYTYCNGSYGTVHRECPKRFTIPQCTVTSNLTEPLEYEHSSPNVNFTTSQVTCGSPLNTKTTSYVSNAQKFWFIPIPSYQNVSYNQIVEEGIYNESKAFTLFSLWVNTGFLIFVGILLFLGIAYDSNERQKKKKENKIVIDHTVNEVEDYNSYSKFGYLSKMGDVWKESSYGEASIEDEKKYLDLIEESLPAVLRSSQLLNTLSHFLAHHKWFGRPVFKSLLAQNICQGIHIIFIISMSAAACLILDSDRGVCQTREEQRTCLGYESAPQGVGTFDPLCYWDVNTKKCEYRYTSNLNWFYLILVSMGVCLFCSPFVAVLNWFVREYIDVSTEEADWDETERRQGNEMNEPEDSEFYEVYGSLVRYIRQLDDVALRAQLRKEWNINRNGTVGSDVQASLVNHIKHARLHTTIELNRLDMSHPINRTAIGKRLILLFQIDLLGLVKGSFLRQTLDRVYLKQRMRHIDPLVYFSSIVSAFFAFLSLTGLLVYFSIYASQETQTNWFFIVFFSLFVEIFVVASAQSWLLFVFMPSVIYEDVTRNKYCVLNAINDHYRNQERKLDLLENNNEETEDLDEKGVTRHLFVSSRVSRRVPESLESEVILNYVEIHPPPQEIVFHLRWLQVFNELSMDLQDFCTNLGAMVFFVALTLVHFYIIQYEPLWYLPFPLISLLMVHLCFVLVRKVARKSYSAYRIYVDDDSAPITQLFSTSIFASSATDNETKDFSEDEGGFDGESDMDGTVEKNGALVRMPSFRVKDKNTPADIPFSDTTAAVLIDTSDLREYDDDVYTRRPIARFDQSQTNDTFASFKPIVLDSSMLMSLGSIEKESESRSGRGLSPWPQKGMITTSTTLTSSSSSSTTTTPTTAKATAFTPLVQSLASPVNLPAPSSQSPTPGRFPSNTQFTREGLHIGTSAARDNKLGFSPEPRIAVSPGRPFMHSSAFVSASASMAPSPIPSGYGASPLPSLPSYTQTVAPVFFQTSSPAPDFKMTAMERARMQMRATRAQNVLGNPSSTPTEAFSAFDTSAVDISAVDTSANGSAATATATATATASQPDLSAVGPPRGRPSVSYSTLTVSGPTVSHLPKLSKDSLSQWKGAEEDT
jgi:hypothetical protein